MGSEMCIRDRPWWVVPTIPMRLAARMVAFVADLVPHTPLHRWVYNPDNVARGIAGASLMTIQDVPAALSLDFARWARRGGPIDVEGAPVIERLASMEQPILFFAGAADRLAPPAALPHASYAARTASGAPVDKTFIVLGKEHGHRSDYGHGDLAIGRNAREELFQPIARFLGR